MEISIDPRDFADVTSVAKQRDLIAYLRETDDLPEVIGFSDYVREILALQPGQDILDVGCGTGKAVSAFADAVGPSGRAVGIDRADVISAVRATPAPENAEFLDADAHELPFPKESFDRYHATRVYMHLRDPGQALAEALRVLRRGGRLVISEPDWGGIVLDDDDRSLVRALAAEIQDSMSEPWIGRRLPRLAREVGLVDVQHSVQFAPFPSFHVAYVFLLRDAAARLVEKGATSAADVAALFTRLQERDRRHEFFFGAPTIVMRAYKPRRHKAVRWVSQRLRPRL